MTDSPLTEHQALAVVAVILDMAGLDDVFLYRQPNGRLCTDVDLPELEPDEAQWQIERFCARFAPKSLKDQEPASTGVAALLKQTKTPAERAKAYRQRKRQAASRDARDAEKGGPRLVAAE